MSANNPLNFHIHTIWTKDNAFYGNTDPLQLIEKYGSPLYLYNENILREQCRKLKLLVNYPKFKINYSAKANTNLELLKIIREEGLLVDAMSPGEIYIERMAGFAAEDILFISNNVSDEEMKYAIENEVLISVDSISQLAQFGKINPGGKVAVRINPGTGDGHHAKVITAGSKTKFGIDPNEVEHIKHILKKYDLNLVGINQHIGSHFMRDKNYMKAVAFMLKFAEHFPSIEFIDFGGGFGIPYHKEEGEEPFDLDTLGRNLQSLLDNWKGELKNKATIKIEPGRFIVAECGVLLGQVHSVKQNVGKKFVGTDIGFNVMGRPMMYNAHHDIEIYGHGKRDHGKKENHTIVGNICESGDIITRDRMLPNIKEGDIIGLLDSGAYGMVMSSNYNCRLRPAEVLIDSNGKDRLIRKREDLDDLVRHFV